MRDVRKVMHVSACCDDIHGELYSFQCPLASCSRLFLISNVHRDLPKNAVGNKLTEQQQNSALQFYSSWHIYNDRLPVLKV